MMTKAVNLVELISIMEAHFDEETTYYQLSTGEFHTIRDAAFDAAEGDYLAGSFHDISEEEIEIAVDISENSKDYLELPARYEIDEYSILQAFAHAVDDEKDSHMLQIAIQGAGAFRRFKDMIYALDREREWYAFRDEQYKEIAIKWCQMHGLDMK